MPEPTAKKAATKAPARTAPETPLAHENLATALAAFQADMPTVFKGQTARIPGKDGRSGYSYQYADLADVAKVAHPLLSRHGLSFTTAPQHLEGAGFVLQGTLRHASGESDTGVLPITGRSAQDLGSSLTYLRRYLLGCMTGIVTDDDEDATLATTYGNERPQADTPEAYQADPPSPEPQTQTPPEAPHQVILRDRLNTLDGEATAQVQAWWGQQGLPALVRMNEFEASAVMSYLDEKEQTGAYAPRDTPTPS